GDPSSRCGRVPWRSRHPSRGSGGERRDHGGHLRRARTGHVL
ncbi:MAG: hypothetical protein AVDCRST_MAG59-1093, partial [uncultured Thermomicrobiales bacterium]